MAIISAVLLFCEHLLQTHPVSQNSVTSQCSVTLYGISLPGYTLLNASRTAENYFDEKQCSKVNVCSANENITFAPASFCTRGMSSSLATRWPWIECHGGQPDSLLYSRPASNLIFILYYMIVAQLHFKWYTLCYHHVEAT